MAHSVKLFVGPLLVLRPFLEVSKHAGIYSLTPDASLFVVPYTDELQDDIHGANGTGEWLAEGPRLSSGDMTFAARASATAKIGYLETEYFGGAGEQSAALWAGGRLVLGPLSLRMDGYGAGRPRSLWPINAVLRGLGVEARGEVDEFDVSGLGNYRSNSAIEETAQRLALPSGR